MPRFSANYRAAHPNATETPNHSVKREKRDVEMAQEEEFLSEEEEQMVEFVKGDTHASKAVPPRFKEHTKLVCGRHSRGGRKKYVKKYPDRVRKVPSRKVRFSFRVRC